MNGSPWCPGTESSRHDSFESRDFKSRASASFATRAGNEVIENTISVDRCSLRPAPHRERVGYNFPAMGKPHYLLVLFGIALLAANATSRPDQFTPLVVSTLTTNTRPFQGTDGRVHVVYELVLTNTSPTPATLEKIEVLDGSHPSKALGSYDGQGLLSCLRTTGRLTVDNPTIEFNSTRIFLIDLKLDPAITLPEHLMHHIEVLGASSPAPKPTTPVLLSYTVAPLDISRKLPIISAPLSGKGWVAVNGCCGADSIHRSSNLSVNGGIYFAQRFAIDWMRLNQSGQFVHGDASDVHNYDSYGADVLAVADGIVVETLNDLDDQKPGTLPDPKTITLENVDGNHVVLDLGDGVFAFYAHLQKGSVRVASGDQVKRGQVLGKLGNTGNTSAPHLHFHLMESPSVLDSFAIAGQVSAADFAAATGVEGNWSKWLLRSPNLRHNQYPLDLDIVDFSPLK
jgi:Peptidase family M23